MRKIGFLISLVLHLGLINWLFYTPIPINDLTMKAPVIKLVPNLPTDIVYYDTEKKAHLKPDIIFQDPTPSSLKSPPDTPDEKHQKTKEPEELAQRPVPQEQRFPMMAMPEFTLGDNSSQTDSFKYKPDFLIKGSGRKLVANPFSKGILPERGDIDYLRYLSTYADLNSNPTYSKVFDLESTIAGVPGAKKKYKGVNGRIDFNVAGLNISPWAKKVVDKIQKHWQLPAHLTALSNVSLSVGVTITVEKSGSLSALEVYQPSLLKELDDAVLLALNSSAPFPSLPKGFPEKNLIAHLYFNISDDD